jgi:hypothetical protein
MQLIVDREPSTPRTTLGILSVDGIFECYTLEDTVREIAGKPVSTWKIPGETAIPNGTYQIVIDYSDRFKRPMPHILNVDGFDGVRIHSGNTAVDTEGCILLGRQRQGSDEVLDSAAAFSVFFPKLQAAIQRGEQVSLTVQMAPVSTVILTA